MLKKFKRFITKIEIFANTGIPRRPVSIILTSCEHDKKNNSMIK